MPSGARASSHVTLKAARAVLRPRWALVACISSEKQWITQALHERCTPQFAHAGGGEGSPRVAELERAEQALPGAEVLRRGLDVGPERLDVVGGHDRLVDPRLQPVALARDAGRLRAREQRAAVGLGRLADRARREQAVDAAHVGLDVAGEAVAVGVGPRAAELAAARGLDARAGG